MAEFPWIRRRPFETGESQITVPAGVPVGKYIIRLVVENDRGVRSDPVEAVVTVVRR